MFTFMFSPYVLINNNNKQQQRLYFNNRKKGLCSPQLAELF